jgi:hypothetical protein
MVDLRAEVLAIIAPHRRGIKFEDLHAACPSGTTRVVLRHLLSTLRSERLIRIASRYGYQLARNAPAESQENAAQIPAYASSFIAPPSLSRLMGGR